MDGGGSKAGNAEENLLFNTESTLGLRVAAIFIILSAGLLGGVPTLFIKSLRNQDSLATFQIRAFSAGIILALALVHILPDAIEDLFNVGGMDYPLGGTCVLAGLFFMVFIEHGAHLMHDLPKHHMHGSGPGHDHGQGETQVHGRGHDRSHGSSHRSAARDAARDAGLSAGQPLLDTVWSEEAPGCDIGSDGSAGPKDGRVDVHAHAQSGQGPVVYLSLEQQQQEQQQQEPQEQQQEEAGERAQEQQARQQAPPEQEARSNGKEEKHHHNYCRHALCTTPGAVAATRGKGGVAIGNGALVFSRHSAGPALLPVEAAQLAAALPEAPRPLAASSLPLFGGKHLNDWYGIGAGKDGNPTSLTAAAQSSDLTAAAASGVVLHSSSSHCHDCVSRASVPNWVSVVEASSEATTPFRQRIVAYLFELGCIFHSFIIGLSLGVNQTDLSQVRALLIALSFHQALEGLSLASVINGGGFSLKKAITMVVVYSLTCPLGVAIGIGIASFYDPDSKHARAAQGCLNGISAGMLLYISLVQLVAEDMGKYLVDPSAEGPEAAGDADTDTDAEADAVPDANAVATRGSGLACGHGHGHGHNLAAAGGRDGRVGYRIRVPSFAAFCLGAASMCLLAVWA